MDFRVRSKCTLESAHSTRVIDWVRNEDFLTRQPVAGIHHQKTNFPVFIVNDKIVHVTDFTVGGMDMVAGDLPCAAQMRIIPSL